MRTVTKFPYGERERVKCTHPFWVFHGTAVPSDGVKLADAEGYSATATPGPDFGCIHWEVV
jgi:hypothetical protein